MVGLTAARPCIHCKGPHVEEQCPLYRKALSMYRIRDAIKTPSFAGSSPAPFIGRFGYPHVNVGLLAPAELGEHVASYDNPRGWAASNTSIPDVVQMRTSLINSRTNLNVRSQSKVLDIAQEVSLAAKPVDIDVELEKIPGTNVRLDGTMAPMGPSAQLRAVTLASNPHVRTRVERVFSDTDLKAADAMTLLYDHGIEENQLSKMLSTATMGIGANRKLVPTRWSITATDDTIGKKLIGRVREFSHRHEYAAYYGGFMGNYYLCLVFPEVWSYELFEMFVPSIVNGTAKYATDNESYDGRKNYAENTAGGYYTVRLAIAEQLCRLKKQASCLALRFVTDEYTVPLGVWVTREATRNAMNTAPRFFSSRDDLLRYAKTFVHQRFGLDGDKLLARSKLLRAQAQRSLSAFV